MIESPVTPVQTIERNSTLRSIELKKEENFSIVLSELTEKQKDFIIMHKSQNTLDIANATLGINCDSIVLIGSTVKINTVNVGRYIGSFTGPDTGKVSNSNSIFGDRQIHFREFSYTLEKQMTSSWLINQCSDIRMSVNSLKRIIKSEYCCIWKRNH